MIKKYFVKNIRIGLSVRAYLLGIHGNMIITVDPHLLMLSYLRLSIRF